jgi:hypothetical protein
MHLTRGRETGVRRQKGLRPVCVAVLAAGLAVVFAAGCLGPRLRPGDTAYVYVAGNGVVTFQDRPTALEDLPKRLTRAGASARTTIKIQPQGEISPRLLSSIVTGLKRQGFARVLFVGEKRATVQVAGEAQETADGTAPVADPSAAPAPAGGSPPPPVPPQ